MRASVRLRLPSGGVVELLPGDLIGRTTAASLAIDDPRISEAHALVSLRGGELHLLSLRRMVAVDGKPVSSVVLRKGLEIALADGVELVVEAVHLPGSLPAIDGASLGRRLLGSVASLHAGPPVRMAGRYEPGAAAHLWITDASWRLQLRGQSPRPVEAGDTFEVGSETVTLVEVPLTSAGQTPTHLEGSVQSPLRVVAMFDTVHIHRAGRPPFVLNGRGARIVSELVGFGGPVGWQVLAGEVWADESEPEVLRHRLDVNLARLRSRLRSGDVRADLVRNDGAGQVELLLYEGDCVEDRT